MLTTFMIAVTVFATVRADPQDLLAGVINQVNEYLISSHLDQFNFSLHNSYDFVLGSFEASRAHFGNFATTTLLGVPTINRTNEDHTTAYFFEVAVGWPRLQLQIDYKAHLLDLFTSEGTLVLYNNDNSLDVNGVIIKQSDGSCQTVLSNVVLSTLGDMNLLIQPFSIKNWIISKFGNFGLSIANRFLSTFLKSRLQNAIQLIFLTSGLSGIEISCNDFN